MLIPNTKNTTTPTTANTVSPSPNISQSRSFTQLTIIFPNLVLIRTVKKNSKVFNNTYSEPFEDTVVASLFTDAGCTAVATNAIAIIRTAVIDSIDATCLANGAVIAPIINSLIISSIVGAPPHQFPLRSAGTVQNALAATVDSN